MVSATLQGLPPIIGPDAEILILGNMPGVASLDAHFGSFFAGHRTIGRVYFNGAAAQKN